jgi:uncharacterized protein (DUF2147 family)
MRLEQAFGFVALLLVLPNLAHADDPSGLWWVDRGSAKVEITRSGDELRGRIVWLRSPFGMDGCPLRDTENRDPEMRDRPVLGLEIVRGLIESEEEGVWTGGEVYEPDSGRSFRCTLELDGPDRLQIRGYIGFRLLGRTTTWFRVGSEQKCEEP